MEGQVFVPHCLLSGTQAEVDFIVFLQLLEKEKEMWQSSLALKFAPEMTLTTSAHISLAEGATG